MAAACMVHSWIILSAGSAPADTNRRAEYAPAACMVQSCACMAAPGAATSAANPIGLHPPADVNCVMDRATLDKQLDAPPGQHQVRSRNQCGGAMIPLTDQQHTDLITVHLGDWLEQVAPWSSPCCAPACPRQAHLALPQTDSRGSDLQVQRHAARTDEGHQWLKKGDAWGYRWAWQPQMLLCEMGWPMSLQGAAACPSGLLLACRRRAYRRMAELLGGRPLQHYDEVFRHERPESKHINQELTPVIKPKHAVIVN